MNSVVLFCTRRNVIRHDDAGAHTARNQHVSDNTIEPPYEIAILPIAIFLIFYLHGDWCL
jgi:hypothetical protein